MQAALLAVIAAYLVTTILGFPRGTGYPWWVDGIGQSLAHAAAGVLCLLRIPASVAERGAWRLVATALAALGLANAYAVWVLRPIEPAAVLSVFDVLWLAFYGCACGALVLFRRSWMARLPWSLRLDAIVVGLGVATVGAAAVVPPVLADAGGSVAQAAVTLLYPVADLVLLAVVVFTMSLFEWRPPTELWWLAAGLVLYGCVDAVYAVLRARGAVERGGWVDAATVLAATLMALAPGHRRRIAADRPPPIWAPLAAPLLAAGAAVAALIAPRYLPITAAAAWLAVATLLAALGRLAVAFFEARQAGQHAQQARTDDLTGLSNRRGFYVRASSMLSDKRRPACALLLLDLDHFKDINDSLGHAAGDQLLSTVAARMVTALAEHDLAARLGGDEFAFLLAHADVNAAKRIAARLMDVLKEGIEVDGVEIQTDASVGISVCPDARRRPRLAAALRRHRHVPGQAGARVVRGLQR